MIYVLQELDYPEGAVKIGYTQKEGKEGLIRRLRALQVGNPRRLIPLAQAPELTRIDEVRLHCEFRFQRIGSGGEWFHYEGPVVEFVNKWRLPDRPSRIVSPPSPPIHKPMIGGNRSTLWRILIRRDPIEAKRRILRAFLAADGVTKCASSLLDISRRTLHRYIHKLELSNDIARIRRSATY